MMKQNDLLARSIVKMVPRALAQEKLASGKPIRLYWGIDPTGARIHLGHAVPLRKMQQFVDAGHEVIFLVGSFTAMIGDPTDRDAMRQPLTRTQVEENFRTYKEQAERVLDFSKVQIRYNNEWLERLNLQDIIELASHFTVNRMLERDMFEKRLQEGKPIHLHEFFYPLMVGYDSVILDVDCEIGGTDQEFNMLAGRHLQEVMHKKDKFVLTIRLLEGTDGRKMSKSYNNCIYLDDEPKEMFGKIMRLKDELITAYFECCTDLPLADIKEMEKAMKKGANPKEYKMRLGREIVTLYHNAKAAEGAEAEFTKVFSEKGTPDDMKEVTVKKGSLLVEVLLTEGLIPSKSEFRRLIDQKGIHLNDEPFTSIESRVGEGLTPEVLAKGIVIKIGKRKFLRIRIS